MNKHTSYQAKMKEQAQLRQKRAEQFFLSLSAQLTLDESFFLHHKKMLLKKIDQALLCHDHETFLTLSTQYKNYRNS